MTMKINYQRVSTKFSHRLLSAKCLRTHSYISIKIRVIFTQQKKRNSLIFTCKINYVWDQDTISTHKIQKIKNGFCTYSLPQIRRHWFPVNKNPMRSYYFLKINIHKLIISDQIISWWGQQKYWIRYAMPSGKVSLEYDIAYRVFYIQEDTKLLIVIFVKNNMTLKEVKPIKT